ncbi:hypothetical protein GOV06_05475 [Candidatus Woesearchaeota archaeon]|nr:hypothetical protein [Candidatus Woesearchaeota archaeon]
MSRRKAQIWYTDFMVGFLIFVIVIFIYYRYAYNIDQDPGDVVYDLMMEAKSISGSLVTAGAPSDWNQSNVVLIGLTDGNQQLMQEKLDMFANMTYLQTKAKLRTPYEYYFYLEDVNGSVIPIGGKEGIGLNSSNSDNLVSIVRIVVYDSKLTSMVIHVWQ